MTSYLIFSACIIRSSMEASDENVHTTKVQFVIIEFLVFGSLDMLSDIFFTDATVELALPRSVEHSSSLLCVA
ncbi:hypothetical protein Y032_0066g3783 [Ancylostoma ceylanicum]|uniref:Uncharacterized protein n=1 Tax=Ancylostoma ceylanicum TaxID=53326 RepID=A0A016U0D8_9BILA|nr:hypothetical protein Y032_0066g3783 [Ancylostoma ceylanicum]